jgi:hypothetical protein
MLLLKSIKDKEKSKKGNFINLSNLPKICQILGCDFTYRTDKQKEVSVLFHFHNIIFWLYCVYAFVDA